MNCSKCDQTIPEGVKFCANCGAPANTDTSPENRPGKLGRGARTALGLVVGLAVFAIGFQVVAFIVSVGAGLGLTVFDIHVSESERASRNVEAAANILGFIGALYLASIVYKRITRKNA